MLPSLTIVIRAHFEPPDPLGDAERIRANFFMQAPWLTPQLAGHLILDIGEWQLLGAALIMGAQKTNGHLAVEIREDPLDVNPDLWFRGMGPKRDP